MHSDSSFSIHLPQRGKETLPTQWSESTNFVAVFSHGCPRCFKSSMDKTTLCCPSAHQVNLSWILYRKKSTYSKQGSGSSLSGRAIGNLMLRPALVLQAILTSHDFHIRSRHSTKAIHGFLWGSRLRCAVVWGRRRNPKRRNTSLYRTVHKYLMT